MPDDGHGGEPLATRRHPQLYLSATAEILLTADLPRAVRCHIPEGNFLLECKKFPLGTVNSEVKPVLPYANRVANVGNMARQSFP